MRRTRSIFIFLFLTASACLCRANDNSKTTFVAEAARQINEPPVITGQNPNPLTVNEDQAFEITFSHLVVNDPDDLYPEGFTLSVGAGSNYSASGAFVTPASNYSGPLSIPVTVHDGEAGSEVYLFQVNVLPVNDAPVITGQTPDPLTTPEDQPIALSTDILLITDPDNTSAEFTMQVSGGENFSVSGTTVMPSPNYNGTLSVPVSVKDGAANSNVFNVVISVVSVNDAPVISAQAPDPLTTQEEQAVTIGFDNVVVSDPDNPYPSGFSLTVTPGSNYTVSSTTITPAPDFTGTLNVPVTVSDGAASSNSFTFEISVIGANDPPVISGQVPVTVDEDNPVTILHSHLQVTDNDSPYPSGFTIALAEGANYTISGTSVIPTLNFSGVLSVPVTVHDGTTTSVPFNFQITVNAVNDPPSITGQSPITINENQSVEVMLSHLTVTDPDNSYPSGFTLALQPGANYTLAGTMVTPSAGFSGVLTVGTVVSDGIASSEIFPLQITVNTVNDPPVITGHRLLSTLEDTPLTLLLSDLTVTDTDNVFPSGFVLTVLPGTNYTASGNSITPAANFNGTLTVSVTVNDGITDSAPFSVQVSVTPVNDAPLITAQQPLSANEDNTIALGFTHFQVSDPDNAYPTGFSLTVFSGADYTVAGTSVTPASGFNGTLTIPVQVSDGVANSNVFNAQVSIIPLNNPPVITGQQVVSTNQNSPVVIRLSHLTVFDTDNTFPSGFTLTVHAGENYSVSGTTVIPSPGFTGTLNVTITVNDGASESAPFIFQIQVGDDFNDPPSIISQAPLITQEEQPVTITLSHLVVTDPDNTFPSGFTIEIAAGADFTFSGATVTPAVNFVGEIIVPVRVNDGVNNSATFDFRITVQPVNDPPAFAAIPNQAINENTAEQRIAINEISGGPGESEQIVVLSATSSDPDIIPNPLIVYAAPQSSATLIYKPVAHASGIVTVTVVATDNGAATPPHQNTYTSTFQIQVLEINNAPTLDAIPNVTVIEDGPGQTITLTGITAGAGEDQQLSVEVSADNPDLFELLNISYASPATTGSLQMKSKPNADGVSNITVKVVDGGSSVAPSVNSVSQNFRFTVQPVNDPPEFTSTPVTLAAVNEPYEYLITITDIENNAPGISAESKPSWLSLSSTGPGSAKLSGTPPPGATGASNVTLAVTDEGIAVEQTFTLLVNTRPEVKPFNLTVSEDEMLSLQPQSFLDAFTDDDAHALASVVITQMPAAGSLFLGDQKLTINDTLNAASLGSVTYVPVLNYFGKDAFYWKGSDGYHLSASAALAEITIAPVNDAPVVVLSHDTLQYEVNGEPAFVDGLLTIEDPDDDSLALAEVSLGTENFNIEFDRLLFENTINIRGTYDFQTGKLTLTGLASVEEYQEALRFVQYNHLNTVDPDLAPKTISLVADDGEIRGDPSTLIINMQYTFIELEIPSGFTPNGDNANDTWTIRRPGGVEQLTDAEIRVFTKRGVKVFEAQGFEQGWDGTWQGKLLPAGSYFYTIDLKLRSKKTYRGVVTILR